MPFFRKRIIAIDTEFERKNTYRPILSIVQIAEKNKEPKIYDVFRVNNEKLKELIDMLSNDKIIKVIHASKQDIEAIYYRFGGLAMKNVFDTQVAHKILTGENEAGYAKVVECYCHHSLVKDKKIQHSRWLKRPLTEEQIKYAKQDVSFLIEIYKKTNALLQKDKEKYKKFCQISKEIVDEKKYKYYPQCFWNKVKSHYKNNKNYRLLKDLFITREKLAFTFNLPREFVVSNNDLLEYAEKLGYAERTGLAKNVEYTEKLNEFLSKVHKKVNKQAFVEVFKKHCCKL